MTSTRPARAQWEKKEAGEENYRPLAWKDTGTMPKPTPGEAAGCVCALESVCA